MPKRNDHTALVNDLLVALGLRPELGFFWKQTTGVARALDNPEIVIRFGLPGAHDVTGLINNGYATRAEIECKTGNAVLRPTQKKFRARLSTYPGHFLYTAHSVAETIQEIETFIEKTKCKT